MPESSLRYAAPALLFSTFFLIVIVQGGFALARNFLVSPHPVGYIYALLMVLALLLGFWISQRTSNRMAIILLGVLWLFAGYATIYRNAGVVFAGTGTAAVSFVMFSITMGARRALLALLPASAVAFGIGLRFGTADLMAHVLGTITYISNAMIAILLSAGILTALQEANSRLASSFKRLENIAEVGKIGLFQLDFDRQQVQCNGEYRKIFGFDLDDKNPIDYADIRQRIPSVKDLSSEQIRELLDVLTLSGVNDLEIELPGGEARFLKTSFEKEVVDGRTVYAGSIVDVTEFHEKTTELNVANSLLRKSVVTDELTGLMNRRSIRALDSDERRARFSSETAVLLLLDIDHFKSVNDTYGHDAGDEVLVTIARILTDTFRASDLVVRWGGEEFLVLLVGSSQAHASEVSEKLRSTVELHLIAAIDNRNVTVSIGASMLDWNERTLSQAIKVADECLYRAKNDGRNRVCTEWG